MYDKYHKKSLFLSFGISLVWTIFSVDIYNYSFSFKVFELFDIFPFLSFGIGLYASYYIFYRILDILNFRSLHFRLEFLIYCIFYVSLLLFGEWLFYHYVGVQNLATVTYPPLAICNCFHGPIAMAGIYMMMGPLFFILNTNLLAYSHKDKA
ncbi:hypothetical protein CL656_02540 [bacterium]|nr:hypothetical protein [bacterium]|tara:strand:- start:1563 stop:2018 length:456 start_codon:yes stop_codon:yes gene_type:complete